MNHLRSTREDLQRLESYKQRNTDPRQDRRFLRRDRIFQFFFCRKIRHQLSQILRGIDIIEALDIGAGKGYKRRSLLAMTPASSRLALTELDETLADPHKNSHHKKLKIRDRIQGDARDLPLPDSSFDLTTMLAVHHHLSAEDLVRAFSEMVRVTRQNAAVVIADAHAGNFGRFGNDTTKWWLEEGYTKWNHGGTFILHKYEDIVQALFDTGLNPLSCIRAGWGDTLVCQNRKDPIPSNKRQTSHRRNTVIDRIGQLPFDRENSALVRVIERIANRMVER